MNQREEELKDLFEERFIHYNNPANFSVEKL